MGAAEGQRQPKFLQLLGKVLFLLSVKVGWAMFARRRGEGMLRHFPCCDRDGGESTQHCWEPVKLLLHLSVTGKAEASSQAVDAQLHPSAGSCRCYLCWGQAAGTKPFQ